MSGQIFFYLFIFFFSPIIALGQSVKVINVNCNLPEDHFKLFQKSLLDQLNFYDDFFPIAKEQNVTAYVIGDLETFEKHGVKNSHGTYKHNLNSIYVYKNNRYLNVFKHELSHWLISDLTPLPRWINEGLAECLEESSIVNGKTIFHPKYYQWKTTRNAIKDGLNLKKWLRMSNVDFYQSDIKSQNYAIAWTIVYFIYDKNPEILKSILLHLSKRNDARIIAINKSYPNGYGQFEIDFINFVNNMPFESYKNGISSYKNEDYGKAISDFNIAKSYFPYLTGNYLLLGSCHERLGNQDSTDFYYNIVATLDPGYQGYIIESKAASAYTRHDYKSAAENYLLYLQYCSLEERANTLYNIGLCYNYSLMNNKAIGAYKLAIESGQEEATAYNNLSFCFNLIGDADSAIHYANLAISRDPELGNSYAHMAYGYIQNKNYDKAKDCLNKAIQLAPEYPKSYFYRGLLELSLGNTEFAINDFGLALGLSDTPILTYLITNELLVLGFDQNHISKMYAEGKVKFSSDQQLKKQTHDEVYQKYLAQYFNHIEIMKNYEMQLAEN